MDNAFYQYIQNRLTPSQGAKKKSAPVITIAREYSCYSTEIAQLLVEKINSKSGNTHKWTCVGDQVLDDVAKRLNVPVSDIVHIFGANKKGFVEDFFSSFSITNKNVSDSVIIRAITDVMAQYINQGYCVVVGRAGVIFAQHKPKSLHIRLVAPMQWRIDTIKKRFKISEKKAEIQIQEIDEKRREFMSFFEAYRPDAELFDAVLNRSKLSNEEIVNTIYNLAKIRGVVK